MLLGPYSVLFALPNLPASETEEQPRNKKSSFARWVYFGTEVLPFRELEGLRRCI